LSVTTRIESTFDIGATPMTPLPPPAWPCPEISEAIHVPWTPQPALLGGVATPAKSGPAMTEPVRSDTAGSTPLSITATTIPRPSVARQAVGALIAFRTHICALRTSSALAGLATATVAPAPIASAAQQTADTRTQRRASLSI
jgi:hypothetical protein